MRRFLHHLRGISRREDVYLVDVTERWNDGMHAYWAFTDPAWYAWGHDGGPVPHSLVRASPDDPVADDAPHEERVGYVVGGALADGEFVGRGGDARDEWLAGREPLGVLTMDEDVSPFGANGAAGR